MLAASSSLACRTAARRGPLELTGCCCAWLRPGAPPRALSSQLYLEALGCSQPERVLGFLLRHFISSSNWPARSSFLRGPCFDRVCRAVPRACNGQAVFSSIEALACSTPTNGCCSRRKDECESREENLLAADRGGKNQVGSRIGKKDGECVRRPPQMRRIEGYSRGKMSAWLHGDVSLAL